MLGKRHQTIPGVSPLGWEAGWEAGCLLPCFRACCFRAHYLPPEQSSLQKKDAYLAAGYPIGSGVVEGACRHVIKERMERSGMRWEAEGAQAVLNLRTIYINGDWHDFIQHVFKVNKTDCIGQLHKTLDELQPVRNTYG